MLQLFADPIKPITKLSIFAKGIWQFEIKRNVYI